MQGAPTPSVSTSTPMKKLLVGILLALAALALLVWNEKRADLSVIAGQATEISADAPADSSLQGQLVSVSGPLTTTESLSDGQFLKPGSYLAIERTTEMYAWSESSSTDSQEQKTYTYNKVWTANPVRPDYFAERAGHENPVLIIPDQTFKATSAKVGDYFIDMVSATIPVKEDLVLTSENVAFLPRVQLTGTELLYIGNGTPLLPEIGDLRIKYRVLRNNTNVTAFGGLQGSRLVSYEDPTTKAQLYKVALGTRSEALSSMAKEEVIMTWIARLAGLLLLWGGLIALLQRFTVMDSKKARLVSLGISACVTVILVVLF